MPPILRCRLSDAPAIPWANGLGTTRELLRRTTPAGDLVLRLSVADVVDLGPFSALPGVDRHLTLLDGPGFTLSIDGRPVPVLPLRPVAFAGEAGVSVTAISGPSRDFNVMTGRGLARAAVVVHQAPFDLPAGGPHLVFAVSGPLTVEGRRIEPGDLVETEAEEAGAVEGTGTAILITLER